MEVIGNVDEVSITAPSVLIDHLMKALALNDHFCVIRRTEIYVFTLQMPSSGHRRVWINIQPLY